MRRFSTQAHELSATPAHNATTAACPALTQVVTLSKATGDVLRARVLQVLAHDSFAVQELCEVLNLPQPALSHHLRILAEAGIVSKRKEGTSVFYQRAPSAGHPLLAAIFTTLDADSPPADLLRSIDAVYAARQARSKAFFTHNADALGQQQELIGSTDAYLPALRKLVAEAERSHNNHALEVGPGDGELLAALAGHFKHVLAIDNAPEMLRAAEQNAKKLSNVRLEQQEFSDLDGQFDLIAAGMVLHHQPSPRRFLDHAAGLLNDHGVLLLADLTAHNQDWAKSHCGDVWLGFTEQQLKDWLLAAGFDIHSHEFFAQRNGFTVQVLAAIRRPRTQSTHPSTQKETA